MDYFVGWIWQSTQEIKTSEQHYYYSSPLIRKDCSVLRSTIVSLGFFWTTALKAARETMEIVNPNAAILTNFEVMTALKNMKNNKKKFGLRNLATITYETVQYLEDTPCKEQSAAGIVQFLQAMKEFNLTKNECLMMVNDPPLSPLHIQLMIEDSDERLTEEQVAKILELAAKLRTTDATTTAEEATADG